MSIASTSYANNEAPLAVKPAKAEKILDIGHTRLFALLKAGELEFYKDGSSTKITIRSINAYIERQIAKTKAAANAAGS